MKLKVREPNSIKLKFKDPISKNNKVWGPNYEFCLNLLETLELAGSTCLACGLLQLVHMYTCPNYT